MLGKDDRKAMLLRLFNDDTPLKDSSKDRFSSSSANHKDVAANASTSTLQGTTAERAKENQHQADDTLAGAGEDWSVDEEGRNGVDVDADVDADADADTNVDAAVGTKMGGDMNESDAVGLKTDIGSGVGIMKIGGGD